MPAPNGAPAPPGVELQPMLAGPRSSADAAAGATGWAVVDPPLAPPARGGGWDTPLVRSAVKNLSLILLWYAFSTCLSLYNRTLLGHGHGVQGKGAFPAPLLMTALQFCVQIALARLALAVGVERPPPGAPRPPPLSWHGWATQVVPNGVCTGLDIGLSNFSLSLITLSFYTMCKSTTPLFLLLFAFIWGLEKPSWSLGLVVAIISVGLLLLVYGETAFDAVGFTLVMTASALSGLRWTITQVLLQGTPASSAGGHTPPSAAGPVHVVASLMPIMAGTVGVVSLAAERLWASLPGSPYFASARATAVTLGLVGGGATIAFAMVWVEFAVIKGTSALTFMVAGTFKEIVTVLAAVAFLGEAFSPVNAAGLAVLIAGVALFNYNKYRAVAAASKTSASGGPDSLADGGGSSSLPLPDARKASGDALSALEAGNAPLPPSASARPPALRTRTVSATPDDGGGTGSGDRGRQATASAGGLPRVASGARLSPGRGRR